MEKGNPRFKPGDVVTVRKWDDMEYDYSYIPHISSALYCTCEYGAEYVANVTPVCLFNKEMKSLCGHEVTITEAVWLNDYGVYAYHIRNNFLDRDKFFTETMFEVPGLTVFTDDKELAELTDSDLMDFITQ